MNLFLLHLLIRDVRKALIGRRIGEPTWLLPVLTIPVGSATERVWLATVLESPGPFCYLANTGPLEGVPATARFKHLDGAKIREVALHGDDRIVRIDAEHTRDDRPEGTLTLFFHLYGAMGAAVLHRDGKILESIGRRPARDRGKSDGKEIAERSGGAALRSLAVVSDDALSFYATSGDLTGDVSPQATVPGLDRALVAAFRAGTGAVDGEALAQFRNRMLAAQTPFYLASERRVGNVVPVPAGASTAVSLGPFDDARHACAAAGERVLDGVRQRIVEELARPLRRRVSQARKLAANLERDIDKAQGHEAVRREAEILAAFQTSIPPGRDEIELDDIYEPGSRVRIILDPSESIQAQIDKRFRKASKLEKSLTHALRRLSLTRNETTEMEQLLDIDVNAENFTETLERLGGIRKRLGVSAGRATARGPATSTERTLRQYDLSPDWFVIVGRSNNENDTVTFHHARPGDLWFHAQSVPGSHVVLKSRGGSADNPPAAVIEQAASIAAHYSKSRHSRLVPVIYTLRKYVRKFRGAKPGQVKCEREKTVMVAPALPEGDS